MIPGEKDNSGNAGFTLLELLVVLTILVLATTLSMTMFSRRPSANELDIAARNIGNVLKNARSIAIRLNTTEAVIFDVQGSKVIYGPPLGNVVVPPQIKMNVVVAAGAENAAKSGTVRFFADGSSSGGWISLIEGSRTETLTINWLTGSNTKSDPKNAKR